MPPKAAGAELMGLRQFRQWMHSRTILFRRRALRNALERIGLLLQTAVQDELRKGPKDIEAAGPRIEDYRYPENPTDHLRIRSGRLIGSITYRIVGRGTLIEVRVGPQRVAYGPIHEEGGLAGRGGTVYIRPRPYLQPAMDASHDEITEIGGDSLNVFMR